MYGQPMNPYGMQMNPYGGYGAQPMMANPMNPYGGGMMAPMPMQPMVGVPTPMVGVPTPMMGAPNPYMPNSPAVPDPNDPAILNSPVFNECPPGMHFLIPTSMIIVKQQVEMLEVFTGWESNNRYNILDNRGLRMYFAAEQSDQMSLQCLGANRPFLISVLNNAGQCCLKIDRTGTNPCCNCNGNVVQITTGDNHYVGQVIQLDCCTPRYAVQDDTGQTKLELLGSDCIFCQGACFRDVIFSVLENGQPIGEIRKSWGGILVEQYTDADTFGVSFPVNLHPKLKCVLLGAVFLIDFMYFENNQQQRR